MNTDTLFELGVNVSKGLRDDDEDIACALSRRDNPQTSRDAAEKMVKSGELNRQEEMVYNAIIHYAKTHKDFTTKDIARYWWSSIYYNAYDICRNRFSGLRDKGKIETILIDINQKTGKGIYKRRDGCRVWRLV